MSGSSSTTMHRANVGPRFTAPTPKPCSVVNNQFPCQPVRRRTPSSGNGQHKGCRMEPEDAGKGGFPGLMRLGTADAGRSEEHNAGIQSIMRHQYAVVCCKKKKTK